MKLPVPFLHRRVAAFSLVEVTLSLGIAAFCLLAVVGLLPVGLGTLKSSREEAAATRVLEQIACSLRSATADTNGKYTAQGLYPELQWSAAAPATVTLDDLDLSGLPTTDPLAKRLVAHVEIQPPASDHATATALVAVAWPNRAAWNETTGAWTNAEGSTSTWIIFRPNPSTP